jgi:putative dehydrogenase
MSADDKAALIGLGSMGLGMARSLLRAGFDVAGFDVSEEAVARFVASGGRAAKTPAEAAAGAAVVIAVVVNAAQTEAVLFGENGCAGAMQPGSVFVSSA